MNNVPVRKIVVLGGGTAGWLSALVANATIPNARVTLVESEEIGILGAGEGTTPHFIKMMDFLGIPASRIVREAGGTIKSAIKFTGWGENWRQNGHYYHGFGLFNPTQFGEFTSDFDRYSITDLLSVYNHVAPEELDFTAMYSNRRRVPFIPKRTSEEVELANPIFAYESFGNFAMHFDARKLADMLKNIATHERGVERIEGKVVKFNEDGRGNIASLELESGEIVESDFLFDCSGFARLAIGKHYKAEWQAHEDLPAKRALPFFIPMRDGENPPAHTEAIAMKYGWVWKIPVEGRYGCGYVYDSDYITEEEAVEEIEEFFGGYELTYPRADKGSFQFKAGYYKTPWIGNVLAVGLSSGFIEPLEATSIWVSLFSLETLLANPWEMFNRDQLIIDNFNEKMVAMNSEIADFIYFHYMGGRDDTDFWKKFQDIDNAPESVKKVLEQWEVTSPKYSDSYAKFFQYISWWQVGYGLNRLNKDIIKSVVEENNLKFHEDNFKLVRNEWDWMSQTLPEHKDFLEALRVEPKTPIVPASDVPIKADVEKPAKKKKK